MKEAAKIMGERHIGSLIVTEKDTPTGIVTERDLLIAVVRHEGSEVESILIAKTLFNAGYHDIDMLKQMLKWGHDFLKDLFKS